MSPDRSRCGLFLTGGVAVLVVALLAVLLWSAIDGGRAGPSYGGKTLRQWIEDMESQNASVQTQAIASVRSIGTNALPTLIEWMTHHDTAYHREFYRFLRSKRAMMSMWPTLMGNSESHCEYRALLGFYAIGREARPALPTLERLVRTEDAGSPAKPHNAARAYVFVDPSEAERLTERWGSSTNHELITAASPLEGRFGVGASDGGQLQQNHCTEWWPRNASGEFGWLGRGPPSVS